MSRRISLCRPGLLIALVLLAITPSALASDDLLASFESRVTRHVLDNGWTFLIVERDVAPVFSFATVADVGSAQEVPGITGLAHMFEHMAFKGTPRVGTRDHEAEKLVLAEVEAAYQAYEAERQRLDSDPERLEELLATFKAKQEEAAQYVIPNDFGDIIEREGGVGLNASTGRDFTTFLYSLPANKVELFAYLESERFLHPVFREFYKERDVVKEERRLRTDSQPIGRLLEQAIATAYVAHPYKQPTIGYMSDLDAITASDAEDFFKRYYGPSNLVTVMVGQLDPKQVIPLLDKYFGRIPARPAPPPLRTVEPPQIAEKTIEMVDPSQPVYTEMYHKPGELHPDTAIYAAIDDVMSNGRTSRLYRALVRDQKIAAYAGSFSDFPGSKYPNLWLVFAIPAKDQSNETIKAAIRAEIERLKTEEVSDAEIERFRTRAKADLLRQMQSNSGLAWQLASAETLHGDWRALFRSIAAIDQVTKDDIKRVANETFVPTNRTVAVMKSEAPTGPSSGDDAPTEDQDAAAASGR